MTHTRTFTHFFNEDDLKPIRRELALLAVDADERSSYLDLEVKTGMAERLKAVELAINRLEDIAG